MSTSFYFIQVNQENYNNLQYFQNMPSLILRVFSNNLTSWFILMSVLNSIFTVRQLQTFMLSYNIIIASVKFSSFVHAHKKLFIFILNRLRCNSGIDRLFGIFFTVAVLINCVINSKSRRCLYVHNILKFFCHSYTDSIVLCYSWC